MVRKISDSNNSMVYQLRIKGHLSSQRSEWFNGLDITLEDNESTIITGSISNQANLFGILKKIRDLGMLLISVKQIDSDEISLIKTHRKLF